MRLEFVSQNWAADAARNLQPGGSAVGEFRPAEYTTSTLEESHPVDEGETGCGSHEVRKATAWEVNRRMRTAQERYDA